MASEAPMFFTFEWPNSDSSVKEVIVTGDFDNWSKTIKLDLKRDPDRFLKTVVINSEPNNGDIHFKFIVNGNWLTSPQYKIDNSHPSNNFIQNSELEAFNELSATTSKSETVGSDYTTISAPSLGERNSPPVMVERVDNNDDVSITNSEVTLTSSKASGAVNSSPNGTRLSGSSRGGSSTILSRFKNMFN